MLNDIPIEIITRHPLTDLDSITDEDLIAILARASVVEVKVELANGMTSTYRKVTYK